MKKLPFSQKSPVSACSNRPVRHHSLRWLCQTLGILLAVSWLLAAESVQAQSSQWIWSAQLPASGQGDSPSECYYRKKFTLIRPEKAELFVAAGDEFEIYLNGQLAAQGQSQGTVSKIDVGPMLVPGINLVAAKVRHNQGDTTGLAVRLRIKEKDEVRWRSLVSDTTWKTYTTHQIAWKKRSFRDMSWLQAVSLGNEVLTVHDESNTPNRQLLTPITLTPKPSSQPTTPTQNISSVTPTPPQSTSPQTRPQSPSQPTAPQATDGPTPPTANSGKSRFQIAPEFEVQQILSDEETGSVIAMEFDEFGRILLSQEGGPLLIADPTKPVNDPGRVRVYCPEVNTCQGILPLNGKVYVTAQGPDGLGLYQLADSDQDGTLEVTRKLAGFTGKLGEHGPHGIQLGPDGMLYVVVGNASQLEGDVAPTSPYQNNYEGDLVPRYEDPGGQAQGVKVPGGTIIRISLDGKKRELVAGGIRNAYDLVFDHQGELYIHDSDMEADIGMSWYRPTMVFHVTDGSEIGWRSGWAKFPQHFLDQTPAICKTGRGSPTGAVLYQHIQLPARYHNTIFLADWSEGRILALRKKATGAGDTAQTEVFLKGRPLNVCDLAVGEDGGLYFCTGGRGTAGGVFRIIWKGEIPKEMLQFESDIAKIVKHPQPGSAWARQNLALLRAKMGAKWNEAIQGIITETRNTPDYRIRAMQLMILYGPQPSTDLLKTLAHDKSEVIRAQAAKLCGLNGKADAIETLKSLLADDSPLVRRHACEGLLRTNALPDFQSLIPMLSSLDRFESQAARCLLERIPTTEWENEILTTSNKRLFIQGSLALMAADPTLERAYQVLARIAKISEGFVNDTDFIDLLRVTQLALVQGHVDPAKVPGLSRRIENEFPSKSSIINHELVRIMAYLKTGNAEGRVAQYLRSETVPLIDRVHAAMYLQTIGSALPSDARVAMIQCLELAYNRSDVGGSYRPYLKRAIKNLVNHLTPSELEMVLEHGAQWPNAMLEVFYRLPEKLDPQTVERVIRLDQTLKSKTDAPSKQLRLGIIAILARHGDQPSMDYLRKLWQTEVDRRNDIIIGLAQQPEGKNWSYLVASLNILDDLTTQEVLQKLATVPQRPSDPKYFRQVIELGYRLKGEGANDAIRLLQHWSGQSMTVASSQWETHLDAWRDWYQKTWSDQPEIARDHATSQGRYSTDQLLAYINTHGLGDANRGQHLFTQAQCAQCHRTGSVGTGIGPDLTHLASRYSLRETLESIVAPSQTIPDRFASKIIATVDGLQFDGMAIDQPDGSIIILQRNGKHVRIAREDIEAIRKSDVSAMPDRMLDKLSLSEVADLLAFLMEEKERIAQQPQNDPKASKPR